MNSQKSIRNNQRHKEMVDEWYSWEHLIRDDVRRLNHRLLVAQKAMMRFQNSKVVETYAIAKLKQIIREECALIDSV